MSRPYVHQCEKCGEWGSWGRKRRDGYAWRCTEHRWPDFMTLAANGVRTPEAAPAAPAAKQGRLL